VPNEDAGRGRWLQVSVRREGEDRSRASLAACQTCTCDVAVAAGRTPSGREPYRLGLLPNSDLLPTLPSTPLPDPKVVPQPTRRELRLSRQGVRDVLNVYKLPLEDLISNIIDMGRRGRGCSKFVRVNWSNRINAGAGLRVSRSKRLRRSKGYSNGCPRRLERSEGVERWSR
jgi:hypothetical protein